MEHFGQTRSLIAIYNKGRRLDFSYFQQFIIKEKFSNSHHDGHGLSAFAHPTPAPSAVSLCKRPGPEKFLQGGGGAQGLHGVAFHTDVTLKKSLLGGKLALYHL